MRVGELDRELSELEERNLLRSRRTIDGTQGAEVTLGGRPVVCLSSNNYLGLAGDRRLVRAAIRALEESGAGAAASPLISGHMAPHAALEREIAEWLGCDAALVFGSGYHANIGLLAALLRQGDEVFSDALNHASLIDGCRLARATVRIFRHVDMEDLERQLARSTARRRLIVSDSIFSMDGDRAPLCEIARLAEQYGAWAMLDEAHAIGVFGPRGTGLAAECGLAPHATIRMGTFGKALGGYGAFVAGPRSLIDLLVNRARAYVYSTALPPAVIGAARAAIEIARTEADRRERLWRNARRLHEGLRLAGLRTMPFSSPIVPLVVGESAVALSLAGRALEGGVLSPAIRPPTVPEGTARLRLTAIATHTDEQIDRAVGILARATEELRR